MLTEEEKTLAKKANYFNKLEKSSIFNRAVS